MQSKNYSTLFLLVILLGISMAAAFIFQPFFTAIMLAVFLAVALQRPYNFFLKITGARKGLSSFLVSLFGIIITISFVGILIGVAASEATSLYQSTIADVDAYHKYAEPAMRYVNQNEFLKSLGLGSMIDGDIFGKLVSQISQGIFVIIQNTYQGVASTIFLLIVVFFTLYYLLIEGEGLIDRAMYLIPLKNSHKEILIEKFISITSATAKGALIVSIVQGGIGMLMFIILGVPSAFILGVAMMFASLIPMFGSGLIWLPVGVFMLVAGNIWQAWFILAIGFGIISTIDNFLRPKLVGKDTQMHPLVVFFATLGGISAFGFLGVIIGPVIVALFFSLWEIYAEEFKGQLKKYEI